MARENLRFGSVFVTLTLHLFRECLVDLNLTTEDGENLSTKAFWNYIQSRDPLFPDEKAIRETYGITLQELVEFSAAMSCPFQFSAVMHRIFPVVCLATRPIPKHRVVCTGMELTVIYDDGRMGRIPMQVTETQNGMPLTIGQIVALWREQLAQISQMIVRQGLDGFYDYLQEQPHGSADVPGSDEVQRGGRVPSAGDQ